MESICMALFSKSKTDDSDDPESWNHRRDPLALAAISTWARVKERLQQIEGDDLPRRKQAAQAAGDALRVARALRAAGSGTDSDVKKAEAALADAAHQLEAVEGERLLLTPKVKQFHQKATEETQNAALRSRAKYRSEYLSASRDLVEQLLAARETVAKLDAIYNAASISFGWGTAEAKAYGMAAGLCGRHGGPAHLVWAGVLPNDSRERTGQLDDYSREVAQVFANEPIMPEEPPVSSLPLLDADGVPVKVAS